MSYRIIKPLEGHTCPLCGHKAYVEESDELRDVRYSVWCSNEDCPKNKVARYSRKMERAVKDFLNNP